MALGNIQAEILAEFKNLHDGRLPNRKEVGEISIAIIKRLPHIHEAIEPVNKNKIKKPHRHKAIS
jgi:hypothetical protein